MKPSITSYTWTPTKGINQMKKSQWYCIIKSGGRIVVGQDLLSATADGLNNVVLKISANEAANILALLLADKLEQ